VKRSELIASVTLLLLGLFTLWQAARLSYWSDRAPGPGFFPFWLGAALTVAAVTILIGAARAPRSAAASAAARSHPAASAPPAPPAAVSFLVLASAAVLLLAPLVGMATACGLFMGATLFRLEPRRAGRNVLAAIVTAAIVSWLFVSGLGVPLPIGPLGF
jgi:putative tricarboxylic transport membrane protein